MKKTILISFILSAVVLSGCTIPYADKIKLPEKIGKKTEVVETEISYDKNEEQEKIYEALKKENRLAAHHLKCFPVKKLLCKDAECRDVPIKFFSLIDKSSVSRCSEVSCDTVQTTVNQTSDYTTMQDKESGGLILKIEKNSEKKRYIEITTLELGSYESFGYCEDVK